MASREFHFHAAEQRIVNAQEESGPDWALFHGVLALAHAVLATVDKDLPNRAAARMAPSLEDE